MVAQHRLAECGTQLLGRCGRLGPEHLVVIALFGLHRVSRRQFLRV